MTSDRACSVAIVTILAVVPGLAAGAAPAPPPTPALDLTRPTVAITTPTADAAYRSDWAAIELGGTAAGEATITHVTWRNGRGDHGVASGTRSWWIPSVPLYPGSNVITVSAHDVAGTTGIATLTVISDLFATPPTVAILAPVSGTTDRTTAAAVGTARRSVTGRPPPPDGVLAYSTCRHDTVFRTTQVRHAPRDPPRRPRAPAARPLEFR